MKTYDLHFNNDENSNSLGFKMTSEEAKDYIEIHNGTNDSYFADYKKGTVSIICNEDNETIFETKVL
jgi:hypothetical protein